MVAPRPRRQRAPLRRYDTTALRGAANKPLQTRWSCPQMMRHWRLCRCCAGAVRHDADRCSMCGAVAPAHHWRRLLDVDGIFARSAAWLVGGLGFFGGSFMVFGRPQFFSGGVIAALAMASTGAFMGASVGTLLGGFLDSHLLTGAPPQRSIHAVGIWLQQRREALLVAHQQILNSQKRVAATVDAAERDRAMSALHHANTATTKQLRRYEVELWRVELARWNNRLEPLVDLVTTATHDECEAMFPHLLRLAQEGKSMLAAWSQSEPETTRGRSATIEALQAGLQGCEALRQALLLRQAQTLAESSPGVAEAFAPQTTALLGGVAGDRISAELDALRHDLPQLREEALRLRAELDAIAAVDAEFGGEERT